MLSMIVAILGLALLIVVHEGGHFLVARLCGMRVERFSIGFGKPLVSFKRGDTTFQISPIPLGGFVQITGLNPHEEFDVNHPYVYPNRPRWQRLAVLIAGPGANYLTAVLIALVMAIGFGKMVLTHKIERVNKDSAAEAVGLKAGDTLLEANGITLSPEMPVSKVVRESAGKPITLKVQRAAGGIETLTVAARPDGSEKIYRIGIQTAPGFSPVPFRQALTDSLVLPAVITGEILKGMYEMITGKQEANLSGPVGIAREMASAADQGALVFLRILMMLSVYLGIFNLLPLPALDGGRVLFLGINSLPIKQVSAKTEAAVHMVGLLLLLGVFVVVTFKDIKEIVVRFVN
ncbi:MAG TPA: M50 family metallopeptidase [Polyangia bacterium]